MDTKKLTAFVALLTLIVVWQTGYLVYLQTNEKPAPEAPPTIAPGQVETPLGQSRSIGISKESKLDGKNLATQVKKVDGKKELQDRRLLINNLKTEKVDSLNGFVTAFRKLEKYLADEDIAFKQIDRDVIVELYKRERVDVPLCPYFSKGKDSLKKDELFTSLEKACR